MAQVHAVAGPRVVHVVAAILGDEVVVGGVVEALEVQVRPEVVALRGVVVDDVEDHLEAGGVERLDHLLELAHLAAAVVGRGVLGVRREEAVGVIAPVVAEAFVEQAGLVHELVHRHQLDGGDALLADRLEHRRRGEALVGAAQVLGHGRMQLGEALHVQLVDHRRLGPVARTPVAAPVERRIDDVGARRVGGAVGLLDRELVAAERIGEHRVAPRDVAREGLGVRVGQQLGRVAAQPAGRVVRTVDAVAVGLPGGDPGQEQVPDEAGLAHEVVAGFLAGLVEEAQLDAVRQAREHAEVHALPGQRGPERAIDRRHPCSPFEERDREGAEQRLEVDRSAIDRHVRQHMVPASVGQAHLRIGPLRRPGADRDHHRDVAAADEADGAGGRRSTHLERRIGRGRIGERGMARLEPQRAARRPQLGQAFVHAREHVGGRHRGRTPRDARPGTRSRPGVDCPDRRGRGARARSPDTGRARRGSSA